MKSIKAITLVCAALVVAQTSADDGGAKLAASLKSLRPDIPIDAVKATPIEVIYALELKGGTVFYGTADGRYLFAGDMYELGESELVNLAENNRVVKRKAMMDAVAPDDRGIFAPKGETRAATVRAVEKIHDLSVGQSHRRQGSGSFTVDLARRFA